MWRIDSLLDNQGPTVILCRSILWIMMKYQINLYFSSTQYYELKLVSSSFLFCRIVDLTTLEGRGSVQPSLFFHVFICITLLGPDHVQVFCSWKWIVDWKWIGNIFYKNVLQFTLLVVNHVLWVKSIAAIKSQL